MADALSQDEINALLSAYESPQGTALELNTNDRTDKKVRAYDFSRPDKFSKDHLRTINMIHSNFAMVLGTALTGLYQVATRVNLIGIDQISYKEYRASIPQKTLLAEIDMDSSGTDILYEINPGIVGAWTDYLCGAGAQSASKPSNLTPIDLAISKRVLGICVAAYSDAWSGLVSMNPKIKQIVNSENYEGKLMPSEVVLVCSLEIQTLSTTGMMTICIPAVNVESKLPELSSARLTRAGTGKPGNMVSKETVKLLEPVVLPCRVVLGDTSISFSDAQQLQVGDVIKIDSQADSEIDFWISDRQVFKCRPGIKGKNLAVVISSKDESIGLDIPNYGDILQPVEMTV